MTLEKSKDMEFAKKKEKNLVFRWSYHSDLLYWIFFSFTWKQWQAGDNLVTTFVPLSSPSYWDRLSIIITVTSHMSLFSNSHTVRARYRKFWHSVQHTICVMCPVSHVRCHMSLMTCHLSQFLFIIIFFLQIAYFQNLLSVT